MRTKLADPVALGDRDQTDSGASRYLDPLHNAVVASALDRAQQGQYRVAFLTATMDGPERHVGAKFGKLLRFAEILVELSADLLACLEVYP